MLLAAVGVGGVGLDNEVSDVVETRGGGYMHVT
jgi:hypothetical protein